MLRPSFRTLEEPLVGVNEVLPPAEIKYNLSLFPNPASNNLFVRIDEPLKNKWQGNIFSLEGRLVHSFIFSGESEINISNFQKGMYIIQLVDSETGNNVHGKFLVAR